ncbi:MAG TPA: diguanylate cyclase [Oxalicibacterium sp.]|nr:diguanylate cyclase [Oxalicibacterium sp.]
MNATLLSTLRSFDVRTAAPDERLNGLVRLARQHFHIDRISIVLGDARRQQLCACEGFSAEEASQALAFCMHSADLYTVADASLDARLRTHPLVLAAPHLRFYAEHPLMTAEGERVGAFCLFDPQTRELDQAQQQFLQELARLAAVAFERDTAIDQLADDEIASRESERRMALAIDGSGTGIWDRNIQTNEIYYSSGWKALFGYADDEISNLIKDSYQRLHPDDLAYVQATMQAHFDGRTPSYEVEHRIRCKDGSYKWVCSRGKVVSYDKQGKSLRMIGTTTDITAMRTMSEQLQQTVDLVTSLTNEVPGLVFQYRRLRDGTAFFSYVSAGVQDIYELSPEELADDASVLDRIIHPDDRAAYHASLDVSAACLTPWHLEYRVQLPNQGLRWRQGDARPQRLEDDSTLWHGFITDVTARKRIETELQEFATTDFLTQLPNRRHFMTQIEAELARIQRHNGKSAAVLMCDLDHFKSINDKWGHAIGDLTLKHFAAILRKQLRKTDFAGRVGGEEFAIMLHGADAAEALVFARRLQQRIAATPLLEGIQRIPLTVSIGIAVMRPADLSVDSALSCSDRALYRAKEGGRNRIECD